MRRLVISLVTLALLSSVVAAQNTTPPRPTNLTATVHSMGTASIKLQWHAPMGPWLFKVYKSVNDTLGFAPIGMTPSLMYWDHNVPAGTTYYYYVTSVVMRPDSQIIESPRSNFAHATPGGGHHARGIIQGTVTDDSTNLPIRHALIKFYRQLNTWSTWPRYTFTDSTGHYSALLDTGTYLIKAMAMSPSPSHPLYIPEWYDDAPTPATATPVTVSDSSTFTADFGLARYTPPVFVNLNGTVTDTSGSPLRHAQVAIIRTIQEMNQLQATTGATPGLGEEEGMLDGVGYGRGMVWRGYTDSLGRYRARVISDRRYIALATKFGYLPEYFDNKTNPAEADIIHVTSDTSGIDFSLAPRPVPQNSISGQVADSMGTPVPGRIVLLPVTPHPNIHHARFGHTDSLGAYIITEVPEGNYRVLALPFSGYAPAFYKANACGVMNWHLADSVFITGNVTGINVCVRPIAGNGIARLSGTIRSAAGQMLGGVHVLALSANGTIGGYGLTDHNGQYSMDAVGSGTFFVLADRPSYLPAGTHVTITPSTFSVDNVNLNMTPASPTSAGEEIPPGTFSLEQNYPNPFNPNTTIRFALGSPGVAVLTIHDILGREIRTLVSEYLAAGLHAAVWDGRDGSGIVAASGVYYYTLRIETPVSSSSTRTMLLLR